MTKREQILGAVAARLAGDGFFGPKVEVEPTEDETWREIEGSDGLLDCTTVHEGPIRPEDEVIGEGPLRFALTLEAAVVYSVKGTDKPARRARRSLAETKIAELLTTPDRTLGGLCDWVEVASPQTTDEPAPGASAVSTVALTVEVLFTASSPTG